MGKWHTPTQVALMLKKIQLDIPMKILYEWEYSMGWTDTSVASSYWRNTKERIFKLTGNSVYSYIKPNTINYINMINGKKGYEIRMSKKVKQRSPEKEKSYLKNLITHSTRINYRSIFRKCSEFWIKSHFSD